VSIASIPEDRRSHQVLQAERNLQMENAAASDTRRRCLRSNQRQTRRGPHGVGRTQQWRGPYTPYP
jgi:hypothetical protein